MVIDVSHDLKRIDETIMTSTYWFWTSNDVGAKPPHPGPFCYWLKYWRFVTAKIRVIKGVSCILIIYTRICQQHVLIDTTVSVGVATSRFVLSPRNFI